MSYKGQPFPSTVVDSGARAKISDGLSVKVEVTGPAKYNAGELAEIEGFLGFIVQNVDIASGVTEEVILNIEQAEYETDQIDPPVTGDNDFEYKVGTLLYWDGEQLTEAEDDGEVSATAYRVAGRVTSAVDKNNVIWMILAPQV